MDTGSRYFTRISAWFRDQNPVLIDACIGSLFTVLGLISIVGQRNQAGYHDLDALGVVFSLACSVPYFVRRRAPVTVLVLNTVALCTMSIIGYPSNVQSQMLLVGAYSVGAHSEGPRRLFSVVVVAGGLLAVGLAGIPDAKGSDLLLTGAVYGAAFLFGSTLRNRRLYQGQLEARAATHEQEREEEAKRAVADERLRIAQELHDVVAHSMGVIAVQAGVGAHVIDADPEEAKRSLESIATTSRSTLTEIRRLLGVLRNDGAAGYQPAPGLGDLPRLVADLDTAGLPVSVAVEGERADVPPGVDLTGYRIVQEALTNVLKHAGPARAAVVVAYEPGALRLEITDDGRGVNGRTTAGGHGLLGMRERVGVYGGSLETGPRPGGGFGVVARLPYGADA